MKASLNHSLIHKKIFNSHRSVCLLKPKNLINKKKINKVKIHRKVQDQVSNKNKTLTVQAKKKKKKKNN